MDHRPTPDARPRLYRWLFERGLSTADAARELDCSRQTVRNITQPFGDERRVKPSDALLEKIVVWTAGAITAADFYPPHLRPDAPAAPASAPAEMEMRS